MMWISPIRDRLSTIEAAIVVVDSVSTWLSKRTEPPDFGDKAAELGLAAAAEPGEPR
jgi:hypothetical protein